MEANLNTVDLNDDPRSILVDILSDSCIELFSDYGLTVQSVGTPYNTDVASDNFELISLISLTTDEFRVSVAIQTLKSVLRQTFPSGEEAVNDQDLQDWIGELSNQLSGRIKNKILPYGCIFALGIPTVIQGDKMSLDLPRRSEISKHRFITESGDELLISLSTLIDADFVLCAPDSIEQPASMAEGEMLFF